MPELPEVETIRRNILSSIPRAATRRLHMGFINTDFPVFESKDKANEISKLFCFDPTYKIHQMIPEMPAITEVKRHGKYLFINLWILPIRNPATFVLMDESTWTDPIGYYQTNVPNPTEMYDRTINHWTLIVHLGMSGQILLDVDNPDLKDPHTYMVMNYMSSFSMEKGAKFSNIVFRDPRRFGYVSLIQTHLLETHQRISKLGIDGLKIGQANAKKYVKKLFESSKAIKTQLMDQTIVAGIGNIYADEICFASKIDPKRHANTITDSEKQSIIENCVRILNESIEHGGSTIKTYVDGKGKTGGYQLLHKIYGKDGTQCVQCKSKINKIKLNGRSTHFCPNCQK